MFQMHASRMSRRIQENSRFLPCTAPAALSLASCLQTRRGRPARPAVTSARCRELSDQKTAKHGAAGGDTFARPSYVARGWWTDNPCQNRGSRVFGARSDANECQLRSQLMEPGGPANHEFWRQIWPMTAAVLGDGNIDGRPGRPGSSTFLGLLGLDLATAL